MKNSTYKITALAAAVLAVAGTVQAQVPRHKVTGKAMHAAPHLRTMPKKSISLRENSPNIHADFTVKGGEEANTVVWGESFNSGKPGDWKFEDGKLTKWEIRKTSDDKAFGAYDSEDAGSLYIEGDYRVYNRENAYAYTPELTIGQNATLAGYIGFSQNYDDYCRLYVAASSDNFQEEVIELYNTGEEKGDLPWRWHPVSIDLSALSGKTVRFRFTYGYGAGDEIFKTGGYFGDFSIDGLELRTASSVDHVAVMTGQEVSFVDLTPESEAAAWSWDFPGATPATSSERNPTVYYTDDGEYDVTLTVTNAAGESSSVTKTGFVTVTGQNPVAKIGLPAQFREYSTRLPLIAPLGEVVYTDASTGFPNSHEWEFTGVSPDKNAKTDLSGDSVKVQYHFMGQQSVGLVASNRHGSSNDRADVTVAYDGLITNMLPDDYVTVFDLDGRGEFPGTNSMKITAYAEKFSKPSRPVMIEGAYVYFNKAEAEELMDQISSVGVHLYTSENGLPGKKIDSFWWSVVDLNYDISNGNVTAFPFTDHPIVDDEFFIVVDGIPEKSDGCTVSFYMADFRGKANSAYMFKDGVWWDVSTYFPAGKNHTSYAIYPSVYHSVMSNLPIGAEPTVRFDKNGGIKDYEFFSYMGYNTPVVSTDSWVKVVSEPNGWTVDTLKIQAEPLPVGMTERKATLTLTDGASTFTVPVIQDSTDSALAIVADPDAVEVYPKVFTDTFKVKANEGALVVVTDMSGRVVYKTKCNGEGECHVDGLRWSPGLYLVKVGNANAVKVTKR